MRRFRFKLNPVLKLRKTREEEALRALGAAQRVFQEELEKKRAMLRALEEALIRRENLGSRPVGIVPFLLEDEFIAGTKQRLIRADRDIMRAQRGVEKALRAYLYARRNTKTLETLHDKQAEEFRKAEGKREQKILDDLTIMRERMREEWA